MLIFIAFLYFCLACSVIWLVVFPSGREFVAQIISGRWARFDQRLSGLHHAGVREAAEWRHGTGRLLARQVNVLSAGVELAADLGERSGLIRLLMSVLVVCLAGSAVALAGSIGFIGLLVPHMVRKGLSIDHRWLLPGSALLGAIVLLLADTLSRVLILPQEVPVGVMTALFGSPFFILLARRGGRYG